MLRSAVSNAWRMLLVHGADAAVWRSAVERLTAFLTGHFLRDGTGFVLLWIPRDANNRQLVMGRLSTVDGWRWGIGGLALQRQMLGVNRQQLDLTVCGWRSRSSNTKSGVDGKVLFRVLFWLRTIRPNPWQLAIG